MCVNRCSSCCSPRAQRPSLSTVRLRAETHRASDRALPGPAGGERDWAAVNFTVTVTAGSDGIGTSSGDVM